MSNVAIAANETRAGIAERSVSRTIARNFCGRKKTSGITPSEIGISFHRGSAMQLVERFQAEATDGRIVEILKWAPAGLAQAGGRTNRRERLAVLYATVHGWRVHQRSEDTFVIPSAGVTLRRLR
jgi:hypothetical protein